MASLSGELPWVSQFAHMAWRKYKRTLEALGYGVLDTLVLATAGKRPRHEHVSIVHFELLGDMVIWIPYGQALVRHLREQGKQISLIIDSSLLPLARLAFQDVIFVGLPKRSFLRSPLQRALCLLQLRRLGSHKTLQPSYPRDAILMDALVHALGAPAIGFDAVYNDRPGFDRWLSNRLYGQLLPAIDEAHQNLRHRAFLHAVGVNSRNIRPAQLPASTCPPIDGSYWVLAPGASRAFRRWSPERFIDVAYELRKARPEWCCVLIGTSGERVLTESIAQKLPGQVLNLAGQTETSNLVDIIAHAELVLGNDSAAGHLAAALGTPSVVVVGGGHWGRCYPYDASEAPVRCLPHTATVPMPCFGCNWICRYTARTDRPFPCIDAVSAEVVKQTIDQILAAGAKRR